MVLKGEPMHTAQDTIEWYLGDLIAVNRHVGEAIAQHAKSEMVQAIPEAARAVQDAAATLSKHLAELEAHAKTTGGKGLASVLKDSLTAMTGFVTGLYGEIRNQAASRMLRDDYTGLSFVMICTEMLHTTALALADRATAEVTLRQMHALPRLITAMSAAVPAAVAANLRISDVEVKNEQAAAQAVRDHFEAWRTVDGSTWPSVIA